MPAVGFRAARCWNSPQAASPRMLPPHAAASIAPARVGAVIWVVLVDPHFEVRFDLGDLCVLAFYEFGQMGRHHDTATAAICPP
jgi:hypothetical protein